LQAIGNDISPIDVLNGRIVTTTREQTTATFYIVGRLQSVQTMRKTPRTM
jgi:methyl-accepting chemotaxis protein